MRLWGIASIVQLRRHPSRRVRLMGWGILCILGLALLVGILKGVVAALQVVVGFWAALNVIWVLIIGFWGLFHPRATLQASSTVTVWALWIALIAALSLPGTIETSLTQSKGIAFSTSFMTLSSLVTFMFVVIFALLAGFWGAAIGAFVESSEKDYQAGARQGVAVWWTIGLLSFIMGIRFQAQLGTLVYLFMLTGTPLLTLGALSLLKHYQTSPSQMIMHAIHWLDKQLVIRRERNDRWIISDLRGAFLGLLAGIMTLLILATNLFVPLQTSWLLWMIQFRNAPIISNQQEMNLKQLTTAEQPSRERIVLLRIDHSTQREMLTTGSETAIHAELIRRLKEWGAKKIVLPFPTFAKSEGSLMNSMFAPAVDAQDIQRSLRDLPQLQQAAKKAGNVILSVDEDFTSQEIMNELSKQEQEVRSRTMASLGKAVLATGTADLSAYLSPRLPAIQLPETARQSRLPVPLLLVRDGVSNQTQLPAIGQIKDRLPQIQRGLVMVDFYGTRAGQAFAEVPYQLVLNGEPVYAGDHAEASNDQQSFSIKIGSFSDLMAIQVPSSQLPVGSEWVAPDKFFKGKIVFLDSPGMAMRETPIGAMPESELLAQATATLIDRSALSQPSSWLLAPTLLLLTVLTGSLCQRRTPFSALWRALNLCFIALVATVACFLLMRLWIDPTLPLLGIIGTAILVTQLTFSLEQSERARNRALLQRFVAPQVVEELLNEPPEQLGLGGRKQPICVMFADIRNFTTFAEQHSPEQVIEIVNLYLSAMTDALHKRGGLLDKYLGDGLMALFRLGTDQPEALKRAVQAAIAMQQAAEQVSDRLRAQSQPTLQIGIALHAGEAIVGLVGNPQQFNYTALGEVVIISQRLQSLAHGGEIIMSEIVYRAVSESIHAEACEPVMLKGLSEPVRYYKIEEQMAHSTSDFGLHDSSNLSQAPEQSEMRTRKS
jgi:class 3 adenylate cyclase/CHASE2 domain-containing sensor protein